MQKTLKALAAIGALACVGYVVAQSSIRSPGQQGGSQGSGGAIANEVGQGKAVPLNGAQSALHTYIIDMTNKNIALAERDGRKEVPSALIEVQCYYILATMRPAQRKHEIDNVWQVGQYQPNGKWNHITSAPMLLDSLLRINDKASQEMSNIISSTRSKWFDQFNAQNEALAKEFPGKTWKTMSQAEKDRYTVLAEQHRLKWVNGRSKSEIAQQYTKHMVDGVNKAKALLTKSELEEFTSIQAAFDKKLSQAYATGKSPIAGN